MDRPFIFYIRTKKQKVDKRIIGNDPVGVLAVVREDGKYRVTGAICADGDSFVKEKAQIKILGRLKGNPRNYRNHCLVISMLIPDLERVLKTINLYPNRDRVRKAIRESQERWMRLCEWIKRPKPQPAYESGL